MVISLTIFMHFRESPWFLRPQTSQSFIGHPLKNILCKLRVDFRKLKNFYETDT